MNRRFAEEKFADSSVTIVDAKRDYFCRMSLPLRVIVRRYISSPWRMKISFDSPNKFFDSIGWQRVPSATGLEILFLIAGSESDMAFRAGLKLDRLA